MMKFKRGRTSRAVAYLMSAVMISQSLLSPVSTVYANAVDGDASQQVAAATGNDNGGYSSADGGSNGRDAGTDNATATDDVSSSYTPTSANDVAAQSDDTAAVERQSAGNGSVQSVAVAPSNGYNPAAPERPIDSNVTVGFYKKKDSNNTLSDPLTDSDAITSDQTLYGQVSIKFTDNNRPTLEYPNISYQLPKNISVPAGEMDLVDNGKVVGKTIIDANGCVTLKYNEDYLTGTVNDASFKFSFTSASGPKGDGQTDTITFTGSTTPTTVHFKDGSVNGNKFGSDAASEWAMPKFDQSDNSYTWTVKVSPSTFATNVVLHDQIGSNLEYDRNSFELVDKQGNKVEGTCAVAFPTNDKAEISLGNLTKGDYYVRYKTKVKASAFEGLKDNEQLKNVDNQVKWSWGSEGNRNNTGDSGKKDPESTKYKMVQKDAAAGSTNDKITWTVKLNTGSIKADMDGYKFDDELYGDKNQKFLTGDSFTVKTADGTVITPGGVTFTDNKLSFTLPEGIGKQELTVTYQTTMVDQSSKDKIDNTAKIKTENPGQGPNGEGTGAYTPTDNDAYIIKRLDTTIDPKNYDGHASWTSTIDFGAMSKTTTPDSIEFDDYFVGLPDGAKVKIDGDVAVKANDAGLRVGTDYEITTNTDFAGTWWPHQIHIKFHDTDAVRALIGTTGAKVTVSYNTLTSEVNGSYPLGTYKNESEIKAGNVTKTAQAEFTTKKEETQELPAVVKKKSGVSWDAARKAWVIEWNVHINCQEPNGWTHSGVKDLKGEVVKLTDKMSDMTYVDGSARYWLRGNQGYGTAGDWPELHPEVQKKDDGLYEFSMPTESVKNPDGSWVGYIELTYKTEVKQSEIPAGVSKTFTNEAWASSDSYQFPKGTGKAEIKNSVLDKSGLQDSDSGLVVYTIDVNQDAKTLNGGKKIVLEDVMGPTCQYAGDLKVTDAQGKELDSSEWTKSFTDRANQDGSISTVMTLALPDARKLKVTYKVKPIGESGKDVEITNTCSLAGISQEGASFTSPFRVKESSSETSKTSYGISITKYNAALSTRLAGAEFTLYRVAGFNADNSPILEKMQFENQENPLKTGQENNCTVTFGSENEPLKPNVLYCFKETQAPTGYKISQKDPFYFVLRGTDTANYNKVIADATAHNATPAQGMTSWDVTDEEAGTAPVSVALAVKKTVNGEAPREDQKFAFELTPVDGAPMPGGAESLAATTKGADAASFPELAYSLGDAGKTYTYRIRETTPATVGWTMARDVTVTVTVGADRGDGTLGAATVEYSSGEGAALFDNKYEQAAGEFQLGLVKTVSGEAPLKGESFEFSATAEGDSAASAPKLENVKTDGDGRAAFAVAKLSDKDAGKTYTYRIHEVTDPRGGDGAWTKAADVIATVEVSGRSGGNKLTASVTYRKDKDGAEPYEGTAQFNNTFKPVAVTVPIKVAKASVNGKTDFKADETYEFGLYRKGADGSAEGDVIAKVSGKLGEILTFSSDKLAFDKPGSYEYLVREETHNGGAGWGAVADIPVTVTVAPKGGDGSDARDLKATVIYDGDAKTDHASFADTYTAEGAATLKVSKLVNGGDDKANGESFDFALKDDEDKELSRVTAKAGKTADFASIHYTLADAGKTFTYTIAEVGHNFGSWFKAADVTATVQVSDNGDGTLKTEVSYSNTDGEKTAALFDNTHAAPVAAELRVSKTINGSKEDAAKEHFAFALTANGNAPMPESSTVTVDGTGIGSFGEISYREPGTYAYTIRETSSLGTGWKNADDVTATVTVVRDEDAKSLKVTGIDYSRATEDKSAAAFDNTYRAKSTEVSLKAFKTLRGAGLKAGEFEFQLKGADGKVLQTVKNDKDGNVAFNAISYGESDLGGRGASRDFGYTISEVVPEGAIDGVKDGVAYDATEHKVKVHVSDDGKSGQLVATVSYDGKSMVPTFTNAVVKTEPEKVSLSAKKLVNGEVPSAAQKFSFDLNKSDANGVKGELVESVQNQGGEVSFKALEYNDAADEWYTISEKAAEGFICDGKFVRVHVVVTKGADGKLSSQVTYVDGDVDSGEPATFENQVAPVSAQLAVKKTVNGGSAIAAERDFSFSLFKAGADGKAMGSALGTVSVKPGDTAKFDVLSFDRAGTYQYVIAEDGELGGGWTKAEPIIATVTVDAAGDGALSVKSVTYSKGKGAALFDNTYAASGSATIKVKKTVNGAAPADDQEFAFELKPVDGAPMPDGAESLAATTKGADAASFPELAYSLGDAGKTYTYRIRETTPATVGWTMARKVTVTVTVGADLGDGTLGPCKVEYSSANGDATAALFNNRYEQAAGEFQLGLVKTVSGEAPLKGESFEFSATAEGANAAEAPKLGNVTTGKDGKAVFAVTKLSDKDAGKTYTYRIHEVTDPKNGNGTWTKAADVIATVEVSGRSDDNRLTASVAYHADGSAQPYEGAAAFDNTFKPSAAVATIAAGKKSVNGATDVKAGEDYTFGLYTRGEDGQRAGKALATVTTKLGESKAFEAQALSYDKPGTYEYLVHEENHNGGAGWGAVADIPVTVTVAPKGGIGTDARDLVATVAYGGKTGTDAALFADTYTATGEAKLSVSKKVTGKADAVKGETFAFELRDAKGTVLSTATAKAGETADFAPIAYGFADAGKTFEYTIHEVGHGSGAWFKPGDVKVTVSVGDEGNGKLAAKVTYDRANSDGTAALFENAYQPASAALRVAKTINGAVEDGAAEEFAFELSAHDGAPLPALTTLAVRGTSTGSFGKIRYTEPGTYRYAIHETSDLGTGWKNAGDVEATVTVERDEAARSLKVTKVEYSNANADASAALFDNRYVAKDVKVTLGATKTLSGATLKADQFEFVLRDAEGNEVARAKNAADGAVAFPELAYSLDQIGGRGKSKTFEYTIEEVAGSEDGVTYDKAVHKVKVVVSDDGVSGKLVAEVAYDGAANAPVFENTYTPHTPKDSPKRPGGMPLTGDSSSMLASLVASMGLIVLATGLRMSRRKGD